MKFILDKYENIRNGLNEITLPFFVLSIQNENRQVDIPPKMFGDIVRLIERSFKVRYLNEIDAGYLYLRTYKYGKTTINIGYDDILCMYFSTQNEEYYDEYLDLVNKIFQKVQERYMNIPYSPPKTNTTRKSIKGCLFYLGLAFLLSIFCCWMLTPVPRDRFPYMQKNRVIPVEYITPLVLVEEKKAGDLLTIRNNERTTQPRTGGVSDW